MAEAELTSEERKHLYNIIAIVFLVAIVTFGFPMFFYLMPPEPFPQGIWSFFVWYGVPLSIILPTSLFLPYEVFYPKRVRKSRTFHAKRFARRALSLSVVLLSFSGAMSISEVTFSKTLGDNAIWPGLVSFVFVFFAAVFLWLRRHNSRIQQSSKTL